VSHPPLALTPLAELRVEIGEPIGAGRVPGGTRRIIPILGGTVTGRIEGTVQPGGSDWSLTRDDGTGTVSTTYPVRTADGTVLTIDNRGTVSAKDGTLLGLTGIRIEAPVDGPWAFLNDTPVVGSLRPVHEDGRLVIHLKFYTVDAVSP
jgi:hypothetical protein